MSSEKLVERMRSQIGKKICVNLLGGGAGNSIVSVTGVLERVEVGFLEVRAEREIQVAVIPMHAVATLLVEPDR